MQGYKAYFKGKKITILGLGLLGKQLGCVEFLAACGAQLIVTDLKNKRELAPSLTRLKPYKNITYVLGRHRLQDFEKRDFILKGQGTPIDSPYILHARKKNIPVEMDDALFLKYAPKEVTVIGVTGTRGKTYTTELIYYILKQAKKKVHIGGNIQGTAALPLLKKIKAGDIVVFELSSWQLQGFGEAGISPHIAVFTSFMPDHMNYYRGDVQRYFQDKAQIFLHQTKNDFLVVRPGVTSLVRGKGKGKLIQVQEKDIPKNWQLKTPGEHTRENALCAMAVARICGVKEKEIKTAVLSFQGVKGRLEFLRSYKGISIYNDTCATTPEATIAGLKALSVGIAQGRKIILIAGGTDKTLDPKPLGEAIVRYTKEVVLLPGTGTEKLLPHIKKHDLYIVKDLKWALVEATKLAEKGDIILFSPGFASFGMFKNEYDRGDQFTKLVRSLK